MVHLRLSRGNPLIKSLQITRNWICLSALCTTYIDKGLFTARNIDLKRQAKFKPRKCHKTQITDCSVFTDRTYSDFCSLDLSSFVEMDASYGFTERNFF